MQRDHAFHELQNLIVEELQNKRLSATEGAMEDFLRLAAAKGYYVDDLIRMADGGISGQGIAERVASTYP